METRLIVTPSKEIRRQAREILKGKWMAAFIVTLVAAAIIAIPTVIISTLCTATVDPYDPASANVGLIAFGSLLSIVVALILAGAVGPGALKVYLDAARGGDFKIETLKYGFSFIGKALGLVFMAFIRVFLWTLLLIVPGIIAGFRYSQAFFILIDDPSKGINQCIEESKQMMNGNKMKYFCLGLSFIGWALLVSIPVALLEGFYTGDQTTMGYAMLSLIFSIPEVVLGIYQFAAFARFYQMLIGEKEADIAESAEDAYILGNPVIPARAEEIKSEDAADDAVIEEVAEDIPEPVEEKKEGYILDGKEVDEL